MEIKLDRFEIRIEQSSSPVTDRPIWLMLATKDWSMSGGQHLSVKQARDLAFAFAAAADFAEASTNNAAEA